MDVAVFFIPLTLVVAQYFASRRTPVLARSPLDCGEPCEQA